MPHTANIIMYPNINKSANYTLGITILTALITQSRYIFGYKAIDTWAIGRLLKQQHIFLHSWQQHV